MKLNCAARAPAPVHCGGVVVYPAGMASFPDLPPPGGVRIPTRFRAALAAVARQTGPAARAGARGGDRRPGGAGGHLAARAD